VDEPALTGMPFCLIWPSRSDCDDLMRNQGIAQESRVLHRNQSMMEEEGPGEMPAVCGGKSWLTTTAIGSRSRQRFNARALAPGGRHDGTRESRLEGVETTAWISKALRASLQQTATRSGPRKRSPQKRRLQQDE
jgi:hypothetical protein